MNWTSLVLLVFVVWSTLHVFAESDIKLSSNTTIPHYGSPFTLVCTVTGDIRSELIIFVRNNATICKRRAYNSTKDRIQSFACATYFNTTQGYHCWCDIFYVEKKVYYLTVMTFKQIDATQWFCKSNTTKKVNDSIDLYNASAAVAPEQKKTANIKDLGGDPRSNPVLIPAVSAACGAVIVLVVIVVAVYIIKKRRNSRQHRTMDIRTDGRNYAKQNNTKERKEPVMKDNELYFMSRDSPQHRRKPVMIDNDIYNLGNGDEELHVKPEDVGDMYSVVNEHGKTKGDHLQKLTDQEISAMYAVVKKDTKSVADNKGNDTNEKREDNECAEDMSDMYTQVIKNKKKNKK